MRYLDWLRLSTLLWLLRLIGALHKGNEPWLDASKTVPERVALLLPQLNIEEKIAMTFATHTKSSVVMQFNKTGVGAAKFGSAFSCNDNITSCVEQRNKLQEFFLKNSRRGIPISFINEGLHGGAPGGTIFPEPIGQAMSWNVTLVGKIAQVIAAEASAIGVDTVFAPVVNMMTDPRFGRLQEGFGENPIIVSHMARASVIALQGGVGGADQYLPNGSVVSLAKHYAAYGAALGGLNGGPADVSNRTLHEVYLRPWLALGQAGVRAVMPSHQTVGDVPMHGNRWMIDQKLRQDFGFGNGVALSDCNDVGELYHFRFATNLSHAAALAIKAGVDWDLQCGSDSSKWGYNKLPEALKDGLVSESEIDVAVKHSLTQKFAAGLFDNPYTDYDHLDILDSHAHRQLALEAAEQSIVLLQNKDKTLPMILKGKRVALFGPFASSKAKDSASSALVGSYVLQGAHVVTMDEALVTAGVHNLTWQEGCKGSGPPGSGCDLEKAITLAKAVDVSLILIGDGSHQCGEWQDRDSLDSPGGQLQLLEAVAGISPTTIVILVHGRPHTFGLGNAVLDKVDALLAAWRPGEEGGTAICNIITGHVNPSAKLAQSWPRTVGQVAGGSAPWLQRVNGKWVANHRGCTDKDGRCYDAYVNDGFKSTPLFYFGFGLSYTTFKYENIVVHTTANPPTILGTHLSVLTEPVMNVSVTLTNTGDVAGSEIVQIYVQDPADLPFVPYWKRMLGFAKVLLAPKEEKTVTIPLLWGDVAMYDEHLLLKLFSGTYLITAGPSSNDTPLSTRITL